MKCRGLLFILFLLFPFNSFCRSVSLDSIWNVLRHEKEDTNKVNTLTIMADMYAQHAYYPTADSMAKAALALSEKCHYPKGSVYAYNVLGNITLDLGNSKQAIEYQNLSLNNAIASNNKVGIRNAHNGLGQVYRILGNYDESLKNFNLTAKLDSEINSAAGLAADYGNLGIVYYEQGFYPKALEYQLKALKIREDLRDNHGIAGCYGNLGNIYSSLNNNEEALKYFQLCLKISEQISDNISISNCYSSIADIYMGTGRYAESLEYNKRSLSLDSTMGNKDGLAEDFDNISSVYLYLENYQQSLKYALLCVNVSKQTGDQRALAAGYGNVESALFKQKKYKEAKLYMDSAMNLANKTGVKSMLSELNNAYSILDSAMGNSTYSLAHYKTYIKYRDSLKNEENTRKMVRDQMNFDFEKKEAKAKADQATKDAIVKADKRKQTILITSVSIGLLLVLAFSGLLFSRYRVTQNQKNIIETQKIIVEEKNKDIMDSITYAKRLQDAILPPIADIKKYFAESFVFYKPKDIVAGDFYWMQKVNDSILIAACDCTGHGVPGALVSVVCSNALNRAVKEFHLNEPGQILDKTRELVLETFEKSQGDIKDGMDISLACLNPSENGVQLKWAGAYNNLWYMQNGEMQEVEANKQPIGKTDNPKPFTTHSLSLSPSTLYLFTDGYADQFGGPKGKKFMYKQLKKLLTDSVNLSMEQQKHALEEAFENWKGSQEQTDDICIIGIRV